MAPSIARPPVSRPAGRLRPPPSLRLRAASFRGSLLAENRVPRTVQTYAEAVDRLGRSLAEPGMAIAVRNIRRKHVESLIADLLTRF